MHLIDRMWHMLISSYCITRKAPEILREKAADLVLADVYSFGVFTLFKLTTIDPFLMDLTFCRCGSVGATHKETAVPRNEVDIFP